MSDEIFNVKPTLRAILNDDGVVVGFGPEGNGPVADPAKTPLKTTGLIAGNLMPVVHALLAADGTYLGINDDPDATGPIVPVGCDLEKGKYRWSAEHRRFDPIMARFIRQNIKGDPDPMIAIALGLRAYRDRRPLPAYTLAWIDTFDKFTDDVESN